MSAREQVAVERAAAWIARRPELAGALARLHEPGLGRVAAVGDSLTADPLSWARILAELARRSSARRTRFVNLAVGGDTTVHAVSRFGDVLACRPGLVVVLVGTNDARRHGSARRGLVPDDETRGNLRLLSELVRDETDVRERVTWRARDVEAKAAIVRGLDAPVIDSRRAIAAPLTTLLRSDGLHLRLRAQLRLACLVLESLSGGQVRTGR